MSAAKKACPVCGCENAESDFFCQNCGSDVSLENRAVTPAAPKAAAASSPRSQPAHQPRLCPKCGQANEAIFILCTNCGFDLSAAGPGPNRANRLFLVIGHENFECKDGDTLGREGTVARSFFSGIGTVSRGHASLTNRNGCWFVTVSPTVQNMTHLDGRDLPRGVEQPLSGEHILKLSTQCEVRLSVVGGQTCS